MAIIADSVGQKMGSEGIPSSCVDSDSKRLGVALDALSVSWKSTQELHCQSLHPSFAGSLSGSPCDS